MTVKHEYPLSKEGYLYMKMLAQRCGIDLLDYRKDALYNRLVKRLDVLKIHDFDTYCNRLRLDLEEEVMFINLITNNTTQFFRENHHFDFLAHHLLPNLIKTKNKIRIWSAGCSTGEEAYSIAMVALETIPHIKNYDFKILATDINTDALSAAKLGIYHKNDINALSLERRQTWFKQNPDDPELFNVIDDLKELITFEQLNLISHWPMHGPFDAIFCRNVIIYFKPEINKKILEKFNQLLGPGSILFLGHSESLHELHDHYDHAGKSIYMKVC